MHIPRTPLVDEDLPAASAFTAGGLLELPIGTTKITFFVTYMRNAVDGRPRFRVLFSSSLVADPGNIIARDVVIDGAAGLSVSEPNGTFSFQMSQSDGPAPADGTPITYVISCSDLPAVRGIRLAAAEVGDPATPGHITIEAEGWGP